MMIECIAFSVKQGSLSSSHSITDSPTQSDKASKNDQSTVRQSANENVVDNNNISSVNETHTHTPVNHYATATQQVQVGTTPIYETQTQKVAVGGHEVCNVCYQTFATVDEVGSHIIWDHDGEGGYHHETDYEEQSVQVQVGTEPIYETQEYTYVDYTYCSVCGERLS